MRSPFLDALLRITTLKESERTFELDERQSQLIARGVLTPNELKQHGYDKPPRESWGEVLGVSLAFIAVLLALSCWRFTTRDY